MEDIQRKDLRIRPNKPKYNFKGNTVRTSVADAPNAGYYIDTELTCSACKGVCILSKFYDDPKLSKKYKEYFHPKYHRTLVKRLQDAGIAPDSNGIYRSLKEFIEEEERSKAKWAQIEALGYDPDSEELLSRKQKAKRRKLKKREEEAKLAEEVWVEKEFGPKEFKEALKLCLDNSLNVADMADRRGEVKMPEHMPDRYRKTVNPLYDRARCMVRGNRVGGVTRIFQRSWSPRGRGKKKELKDLLELHSKDIVLETDQDVEVDKLLAALI